MELTFAKSFFVKPQEQEYENWMQESVEFFRQLGFFESQKQTTTPAIVKRLEKLREQHIGVSLRYAEKNSDFNLISLDTKRVWVVDTDVLVIPGNEVYIQALQELSAISRKLFSITAIKEVWQGEEGPIMVGFTHKRKRYEFCPQYLETYFDYGILAYLNMFLEGTRFRFELCGDMLKNPIVLMLHEEEKELLTVRRGWKFADL